MNKTLARLAQQIDFIVEVDKLKHVLRRTRVLADPPHHPARHENSAEHSWHIALLALLLSEHCDEAVDLPRVIKMLLVHDLVEIDAGDTFAFADQTGKAAREQAAATRIFGLLPDDQRTELRALWEEFEAQSSAEARFANAVDRLMPLLHNLHSNGGSWVDHGVTRRQADGRFRPIGDSSQTLWTFVQQQLDEALARGFLRDL